ncbi:MAG TPA: hypothetical protein VHS58_05805 [Acetobacteraceae bacterium]|jgi:hypothetical protein|nr:hypothetical protein [Acetobacteraceae bacterium]
MISTRLHAKIDFAVSGLLGVLALSGIAGPRSRRLFRAAGTYHASYAALTDYEAGLLPVVSMRDHLLLDTIGAATLCVAGLLTRDSKRDRRLLLGIGMLELAVIAASDTRPAGRPLPEPTAYEPVDVPKPVAQDVWIVDSGPKHVLGLPIPVRMTVIRLPSGELLLHSPTRYSARLRQELERFGPIRFLVAPNSVHWTFIDGWQRALPDARTLAVPGLRKRRQVRRSGLRIDGELCEQPPADWGGAIELVAVVGAAGFTEMAFFHRPSRTLVLTDLVQNFEPHRLPTPARLLMRLAGANAPNGRAPIDLRAIVLLRGHRSKAAARRLIALTPERLVFAHGRWYERDATEALRRSLAWLE